MPVRQRPPAQAAPPDREQRFTVLFQQTHAALLAYAVRRVADPSEAADVVAEAFLVAWRRIDEVPDGPDARPWMFGVARRVLANAQRGERRRHALADRLRLEIAEAVPAPDVAAATDVERAMRRLDEDDREVLRLTAWEQLARDEIALVLGVSRGAVRMRLHRARRRLAAVLAEYGPAASPPASSPREPAPHPAAATAATPTTESEDPR
ncbi:RNA polymerase sigma factor [Cellulomonas hominis]|uniref:RNA polymerase sigma factor n=1 Tax=Cellulomonas hominis TaxID=156981 RepID=UPI00144477DB|nr:RNA polymerase sigma factor [Cellulomonas hominis]NKY12083.1 RNA polymerase sigma factor [Cellulomonas hominis]